MKTAEVKKAEAAASELRHRACAPRRTSSPRACRPSRTAPPPPNRVEASREATSPDSERKKEKKSRDRQDLNLRGHCPRDIE